MDKLHQIDRIKIKLNLAKNTDSFLEIFGANSHKYRLDAPADISEIEAFERKYHILLPEGYKTFLTQIGNGGNEYKSQVGNSGAGPDYGVYRLGDKHQFLMGNPSNSTFEHLAKEPFFNSGMHREEWKKIYENMPDDISDDEYDKEFERVYAGILTISTCGCSGYAGIMLSGENKGRVVYTCDELEYCPQFAKEENFLDWYENWLDLIVSGQGFIGGKPPETVDKLFKRYETVEDIHKEDVRYWKMVALRYIRMFDSLSSEYIEKLWGNYRTETDGAVKLYILNLLVKFDYENTKSEMEWLGENNPAEFLKILHLFASKKTLDWQNTIQNIRRETSSSEIMEYINYVTINDCKTEV
jgi:hypothetical protein